MTVNPIVARFLAAIVLGEPITLYPCRGADRRDGRALD
jgi:hypothetical protein